MGYHRRPTYLSLARYHHHKILSTSQPIEHPARMSSQTPSSQHTRLKDFSVESQRKAFIAEQESERAAAENRRTSRRITKATSRNGVDPIQMSGMMSRLDDDDSIGSCSIGSEESFYLGIERADYTSPDNLEMYGESQDFVAKEDRLGIGRVKIWEDKSHDVVFHEEGSSLYTYMTGGKDEKYASCTSKKDVLVALPLVVDGINYKRGLNGEMDHSQVYQQDAAEGKMFINKMLEGSSAAGDDTVADVVNQPASTPARVQSNTPFTTPRTDAKTRGGHYPTISPMTLFSPYIGQTSNGEDNTIRQLREREIRKDATNEAKHQYDEKIDKLQELLLTCTSSENNFSVSELKKQMNDIIKSGS